MTATAALAVPTRTFSPAAWAVPPLPPEYDPWNRYEPVRAPTREDPRIERDSRRGQRPGIEGDAAPPAFAGPNRRASGTVVPFLRAPLAREAFAALVLTTPYSAPFMAQMIAQEVAPDRLVQNDAAERVSAAYEATIARTDRYLVAARPIEARF